MRHADASTPGGDLFVFDSQGVARRFRELFPASEPFLVPGARHFVQMDEPGEVARLILSMPVIGEQAGLRLPRWKIGAKQKSGRSDGVFAMDHEPGRTGRWPKWALFISFVAVFPVPYFMVVVGGLVPLSCLLLLAVRGTVVAVPKFTAEGFWTLGILWAHVAILGGLLYLVA